MGDHLPPEQELAEQFQVSRTAVREAVKALSEKGLVQVFPGKGTFITNDNSQAVRQSLGMLMKIGQVDRTQELVEVREIFEHGDPGQPACQPFIPGGTLASA